MYRYLVCLLLCGCAPGVYSLKWDNDIFGGRGTDHDYTNGLRVGRNVSSETGSSDVFIGQLIYTPANKQATSYQPTQRPYAGFLYGGVTENYIRSPNIRDSYGFTGGVVGPSAGGEAVQNTVHRWINNRTAKGWRHQIKDEPALMGTVERSYWYPVSNNIDVTSTAGVNLGNVFTQGYTSISGRIGTNLDTPFDSGGPIFPRATIPKPSAYLLGTLLGRAVARNIFLDGNTFRDSASIGREVFVGEARLGFMAEYKKYKVGFIRMFQTKEHDGETRGARFGEIILGYEW
jgi:lipid A 3-O-deacylase